MGGDESSENNPGGADGNSLFWIGEATPQQFCYCTLALDIMLAMVGVAPACGEV